MNRNLLPRGVVLGALVVGALALRLIQLDWQPLWWDEGYSVFFASRDFATMLARTAVDIHPPLYYALLQEWSALFGTDSFALRLLSVVIGVAAVPLLYFVARQLFNARVAVVSAFLLSIAPLHIYYSQELRMYGLVTLLSLISVALQLHILTSDNRRQQIARVGYVLVTALALYTQYFAAFLIAAEIAVILYLKYRARWTIDLGSWVLNWVGVSVLYLPWVIYAGPKLFLYVTDKVGIEQYSRLDPATYLGQHFVAFSTGHVTAWTWIAWGAVPVLALALVGFLASRKYQADQENSQFAIRHWLSALYLLIPLGLGFLVNLVYTFHPVRYERLLLFALPFLWIYVACGIVALGERERALGIVAGALVIGICALSLVDFYTVPRYPDDDYRPLIQEMENLAAEDDLVYAIYPWQIGYLTAYYHGAPLQIYEVTGDTWIKNPDAMEQKLTALRQQNLRAWILAYQKQGHILEDRLTNEYSNDYIALDQTFGNTRLEYFTQGNATDFELEPIVYTPALTLRIQYAAFDAPNRPHLALARFLWNATDGRYAYSLRLVDAAGSKLAQQDEPIPSGTNTFRRALVLPKNLAAGDYTLRLVAYLRADGSPILAANGDSYISLAKLLVAP